ncbi:MAG: MFS transporter [Bradyrhizobium sp.]|nr:MAG: MFS transporter [Bradyrhizobium sp.]
MSNAERLFARAAVSALFLVNGFGMGVWAGAIAPLQTRLDLSPASLSLALLGMAAGAVVAMPLAPALAARLGGSGRAAAVGVFLYAPALIAPTLAQNLPTLVIATFVLGAFNGLMDVAMNAHGTVVERAWGGAIMSSLHAAWSCGGIAGAVFSGAALHAGMGASGLLLSAAAAALLVGAIAAGKLGAGDRTPSAGPVYRLPDLKLIGLSLVALLGMLAEGAMIDWSALYLTLVARAPSDLAAGGYGVFAGAMFAGRLIGDAAVQAAGRARVVAFGAGLAAVGVALVVIWPATAVVFAGYALMGVGLANVVPIVFSQSAARAASPAAGVAMAATVGYAGLMLGPVLIGAAAGVFSLRVGFALIAAALAAIVAIELRARQT